MRRFLVLSAFALGAAPALAAQGTLSTQGFGYPPGQVGARARAMGTGLAELDPLSPLNPAAIGLLGRPGVYVEYAPEKRRVFANGGRDDATISRFPIVSATIGIGERWLIGLSSSTLLDRTWETSSRLIIGTPPDTASATTTFRAAGAMNDVRLAAAYRVHRTLRVGLGVHAITGESRTQRELVVPDSTQFIPALERNRFGYSGHALSAGVDWRPSASLGVGVSARTGGSVRAYAGDSLAARGEHPTRYGASVEFSGIRGISLAARAGFTEWSRLAALTQTATPTHDAWEYGIGLEGRGPSVFGTALPLRGGLSRRTLPFGLPGGAEVTETGIGFGTGTPLAGGRAFLDLTIERLLREADGGDARERAWVAGFGLLVRL